ncbi:uncharacterized protein VTP21DRAFT_6363 [Calcarisporiella thermophila]|uniref:uncharacterized protein n=1 Tax=Calcarisporiella thermophila TaxID=911321 RepID=UPI003742B761
MNSGGSIIDFPLEIILNILSYLPRNDLLECALVRRTWANAALQYYIWQHVRFEKTEILNKWWQVIEGTEKARRKRSLANWHWMAEVLSGRARGRSRDDYKSHSFYSVTPYGRYVRSIDFSSLLNKSHITDKFIASLLNYCPNLINLNLRNCYALTDSSLYLIPKRLPNLRQICLDGLVEASGEGIKQFGECLRLEVCSVRNCIQIRDEDLKYLVTRLKGVRKWFLKHLKCSKIGYIIATLVDTVEELDVGYTNVSDAELSVLASRCPNMTTLDLSFCHVTDSGIAAIAQGMKSLTSLNISNCRSISCDILPVLTQLPLTSLQLDYNYSLNDSTLFKLVSKLPQLRRLSLAYCSRITDEGFHAILDKCKELETLSVECCLLISKNALLLLPERLTKLRKLDVSGLGTVDDEVVQVFVEKIPKLHQLSLHSCYNYSGSRALQQVLPDSWYKRSEELILQMETTGVHGF